jgi:hypothetical protein
MMARETWLVTVAARCGDSRDGVAAAALLRDTDVGGVISTYGFGPGAVDLEVKVIASSEMQACGIVHPRVADALGSDWLVDTRSGTLCADEASD